MSCHWHLLVLSQSTNNFPLWRFRADLHNKDHGDPTWTVKISVFCAAKKFCAWIKTPRCINKTLCVFHKYVEATNIKPSQATRFIESVTAKSPAKAFHLVCLSATQTIGNRQNIFLITSVWLTTLHRKYIYNCLNIISLVRWVTASGVHFPKYL